ncbi:NADH-quinone oxidoreductase subunit NuoE family protein [Planctomicrobium sp. SH664]|uniref:NADH-quinone oxidoreductase subunit NuoE family protein n=1 Tax=Planctomicrobium sp. SH664 TaxID=3448125 RepID=UPI003F5BDF0C
MPVLSEEIRNEIRAEFPKYPNKRAVTLPALHIVHHAHHSVSMAAMEEIAELLELSPAEVYDTMSFYGFFRDEKHPYGEKRVWVCRSISCALRGGEELLRGVCEKLNVTPGGTTADGKVTLEFAECLGACEGAPCILVNDECHMDMTEKAVLDIVKKP